jgi:pimeloyl-ACP methyl ester carboxylesterase
VDTPDAHWPVHSPPTFGSGSYTAAAALDAALGDRDWTVLPHGIHRAMVDVPSGRLASISMGEPSRPRVLLVPGATGSKEDFCLMLPLLAAAGYRAESFDLAGQYQSAAAGPEHLRPPRHHYDYSLFVNDLLAVLESGPGPVHVLGYSFAATVAQIALAHRPDLFASLTLLSAPPQPGQQFRGVKRIGWVSGFASDRVGASLMIWGVSRNLNRAPPGRVDLVHTRFKLTRRSSVDDIIGLMKNAPDLRSTVAAAPIPKLVAVGEHDLWPLALHSDLAREIGASIAVYRTGHSPCEQSPHQLVRDLLALFERSELRA